MEKYRVTLTDEERTALEQLISKGKAAARRLTHARILLLADDSRGGGCPDEEIVATLDASPRTVARVRRRLVTEGFQAALDHRPQPARPDKIKIRGTPNRSWSNSPAPIRPRAGADGPCSCWPTRWSCSAWSMRSASRRCVRR
jgi:hypothetical protein